MPEDRVTIDPEFRRRRPADGQGRLRLAGVIAIVVASFIFGWLLGSPSSMTETSAPDAAATTSDAPEPLLESADAPEASSPSTTTTTTEPESAELPVSLAQAVPGFTDTITMSSRDIRAANVERWGPSENAPESAATFSDSRPPWFNGIDAGGGWYALQGAGVLSVARIPKGNTDPASAPTDPEVVAARVASSAWHDSDPARLAWLACPRAPGGSPTLFTLDVSDKEAEPVALWSLDHSCDRNRGVWLSGWGNWGFLIGLDAGTDPPIDILYSTDGIEIARSDRLERRYFVAGSPDGTSAWADHSGGIGQAQAYRLSEDGQQRTPLPGVAAGELLSAALWSPDGARLAITVEDSDGPIIRVVDASNGNVIGEAMGNWVRPQAWSSDGRFVGYERFPDASTGSELAIYDTMNDATVALPISKPIAEVFFTASS